MSSIVFTPQKEYTVDARQRVLLMAIRQALIIALGALEDFLCLERSIIPQRKRTYVQKEMQEETQIA
jgi:hypothetical protein